MNDQLQATLGLLDGGPENLDPTLAAQYLKTWHTALGGVPGSERLRALMEEAWGRLEEGRLEAAGELLPALGRETLGLVELAPADDQQGLQRLADTLGASGN